MNFETFLIPLHSFPLTKDISMSCSSSLLFVSALGEYLALQEAFVTKLQSASRACSSKKDTEI